MSDDEPKSHSRLRPAQVFATTLAAVSGAFMASRLGLYGTVLGAGLLSLISTVGAELYLRSLDRTTAAAKAASGVARGAALRQRTTVGAGTSVADDETRALHVESPAVAVEASEHEPGNAVGVTEKTPRKGLRWSLIVGGTIVAFVLSMLFITGFEAVTGKALDGDDGHTVSNLVTGQGASSSTDETDRAPAEDQDQAPVAPTESPTPRPTGEPLPGNDDDATQPPTDEEATPPPDEDDDSGEGETEEPAPPPDETTPPDDESVTPQPDDSVPAP